MIKRKRTSELFHLVDPQLRVIDRGKRSHKRKLHCMTKEDWDRLNGSNCPSCGGEIFKTYGPFSQCYRCFYRRKDTFLQETECQKCNERALKVSTLSLGLQTDKIICPACGTYYP